MFEVAEEKEGGCQVSSSSFVCGLTLGGELMYKQAGDLIENIPEWM